MKSIILTLILLTDSTMGFSTLGLPASLSVRWTISSHNVHTSLLSSSPLSDYDFDPASGPLAALTKNNKGGLLVDQRVRPRRNRKSAAMRNMVRETVVTPSDFIYPLFIHDEDFCQPIESMPGCERHSLAHMMEEIEESVKYGVMSFVLFPKVPDELKTNYGVEAYNPEGIVPRAIRMIKEKFPEVTVITDVALDPYR